MIKQKLQEQMILALKSKENKRLIILRYIIAKIQNEEINKKRELNNEEIIIILKKLLQEIKESIEAAKKNSRDNLLQDYENEKKIIESFIPAQLDEDKLKDEIDKIIEENKNLYQKNPKSIIGLCIKNLRTKADVEKILSLLKNNYGIG